jgi:hypothetical protein
MVLSALHEGRQWSPVQLDCMGLLGRGPRPIPGMFLSACRYVMMMCGKTQALLQKARRAVLALDVSQARDGSLQLPVAVMDAVGTQMGTRNIYNATNDASSRYCRGYMS